MRTLQWEHALLLGVELGGFGRVRLRKSTPDSVHGLWAKTLTPDTAMCNAVVTAWGPQGGRGIRGRADGDDGDDGDGRDGRDGREKRTCWVKTKRREMVLAREMGFRCERASRWAAGQHLPLQTLPLLSFSSFRLLVSSIRLL